MQSRRDQVQAQTYVHGRLVSALMSAAPDLPEPPTRRITVPLIVGALLAGLMAGGVAVYGMLRPGGSTAWRATGALIVEKETGNRYVLAGGRLSPVRNYTSARLLLGRDLTLVTVSRASLAGTPHDPPVGIEGAPDSLPAPAALNTVEWRACHTASAMLVELTPQPAAALPANAGVLVTAGADRYLIAGNRRYRVRSAGVVNVLGFGHQAARPVTSRWLDLLPAGPDLSAPPAPGSGRPGPRLGGRATRVGQVIVVNGSDHYRVGRASLRPITPFAAALALGDPATRRAYRGGQVAALPFDPVALAAATIDAPAPSTGLPTTTPAAVAVGRDAALCLTHHRPGEPLRLSMVDRPAAAAGVAVAAGSGALVAPVGPGGEVRGPAHLVTDTGRRYPLAAPDVAERLGYGKAAVAAIPGTLLDLLPAGPLLGTAQAAAR